VIRRILGPPHALQSGADDMMGFVPWMTTMGIQRSASSFGLEFFDKARNEVRNGTKGQLYEGLLEIFKYD